MSSPTDTCPPDTVRRPLLGLLPRHELVELQRDGCVGLLIADLLGVDHIRTAHLYEDGNGDGQPGPEVCVHFDPAVLGSADVEATIADLSTAILEARHRADPDQPAPEYAEGHDPDAAGRSGRGHDHDQRRLGQHAELVAALLAGAAWLGGVLTESFTTAPGWVAQALFLAAYGFGGLYAVPEAVANLRRRRLEVDSLMIVAAVGAAAVGQWAEGAVLLFLFSLGHALEERTMARARRSIEALGDLAPATALLRRGDVTVEVPVEQLRLGDLVLVRPHEKIPVDGDVVKGTSTVDQAPITGESIPVDKTPAPLSAAAAGNDRAGAAPAAAAGPTDRHRVFAGTINGNGALEIAVTSRAEDNTLARVVRMVRDAEEQRSPTHQLTVRLARLVVPAVLLLVLGMLLAGLVVDEPFSDSFYRAMAVLVAASPCALAIAVPSAVISGIGRAARSGVLIRGGAPLERLGRLSVVAFDKTGTLTSGQPRMTDVVPAAGVDRGELLATAVAAERLSDHPLARAVVEGAGEQLAGNRPVPLASGLEAITGRGVQATVDGELVHIGSSDLFDHVPGPLLPVDVRRTAEKLEAEGRTTMIVRRAGRYLGVVGVMDTPRPEARAVVTRLHQLGIRRTVVLSGDNQRVVETVARQVGVDEACGGLLPEDKVAAVDRLGTADDVAMVGDGVNDAPALAHASVGIAMGAAGSPAALETAHMALMADDLSRLPFATELSRRAARTIRQNLWFSLGLVAVLVPATVLGLGIGPAILAHEGSTLVVVANALRLQAFRDH